MKKKPEPQENLVGLFGSVSRARILGFHYAFSGQSFYQRGAVLVIYALGALLGLLALIVNKLSVLQAYVLAIVVVLGSLPTIVLLEKAPYERQQKS